MATGANQAESSLVPIANAKTTFLGGTTTAAPTASTGTPGNDLSGLWFAGAEDTGLPTGAATVEVRAWYDPSHNTTYAQALANGLNTGKSSVLNINLTAGTDPTIQSLDSVNMAAFSVSGASITPEPSTFALAGLGAAAALIFRRRK